jgi:antitoxin component of MazEF toxin-antitoxin module
VAASRLLRIGNSMGVILPKRYLDALSWWQADTLHVRVEGDTIVVRNLTQKQIQPLHARADHGDLVSRKA